MELNIDSTYDGMEYKRWKQQADEMKMACDRIVSGLPPEEKAVHKEFERLNARANEAMVRLAYVTGYQHGVKCRGK